MNSRYIEGKAVMGALGKAGELVKCLKGNESAELDLSANTSDVKTKDDAIGDHDSVDYIGGTLSFSGKVSTVEADNMLNAKELAEAMLNGEQMAWSYVPLKERDEYVDDVPESGWELDDQPDDNIPHFSGMCLITNFKMSAAVDGFTSYSVQCKIQGRVFVD